MLWVVAQSCPTLCDPMICSPSGSSVHGDSPGKNTGVGCHALLQGYDFLKDSKYSKILRIDSVCFKKENRHTFKLDGSSVTLCSERWEHFQVPIHLFVLPQFKTFAFYHITIILSFEQAQPVYWKNPLYIPLPFSNSCPRKLCPPHCQLPTKTFHHDPMSAALNVLPASISLIGLKER